jgi:hypothetical protein
MSTSLKTLLGWLLLVAATLWVLDWQDQLVTLQQESQTSDRLRQRLEAPARTTNWVEQASTAREAQNAWLDRLVEVDTTGVFRAVAMERLADLCTSLEVPCQVGATGEKILNAPDTGRTGPGQASTSTSSSSSNTTQRGQAGSTELPGLVSATVKVTVPLNNPRLQALIHAIETGPTLRSIDRFSVRASRVEMTVQTYGMLSPQMQQLRAQAQPGARPSPAKATP